MRVVSIVMLCLNLLTTRLPAMEPDEKPPWSSRVQTVLDVTTELPVDRGERLPLYLWPAMNPGNLDATAAEQLVADLDRRGIGLICSWSPNRRDTSLESALTIARAQQKLNVRININASACLNRFFNGDEQTAHIDDSGKPFWDESFDVRTRKHHMGCPFALTPRMDPIREQTAFFVEAYKQAGMEVDFVFVDWEIDGPIEFNRAHETSKKCARCRRHLKNIDNFHEFQKSLRDIRSLLQRYTLAEPVSKRFPSALIGNYAIYPHNGYRYWYDYFEYFVEGQPYIADRGAKYRLWSNEFAGTRFTCAMPVAYTWYPTFGWYDFENTDYRWFYNMLLVGSNAGKHTPPHVPVITFVHWHTTAPPEDADPSVKQLSHECYQELLWHLLLRGTDTFFLWCPKQEDADEVRLVHEVYSAAQSYGQFLEQGTPIEFGVPDQPGTVVSGLLLRDRLLVRRTDFGESQEPVTMLVNGQKLAVEPQPGECRILHVP